jgi:hypothetical protein
MAMFGESGDTVIEQGYWVTLQCTNMKQID